MFSLRPLLQSEDRTHLGERLDFSTVASRTFSWQETKRTVSGSFVLSIARREKGVGRNSRLQRAKDELSGLHEKKDYFRQRRSNVRLAKGEERRAGRPCIPYGDCKPESATDNQGSKGNLMAVVSVRIPHCVWRLPTVLRFLKVEEI